MRRLAVLCATLLAAACLSGVPTSAWAADGEDTDGDLVLTPKDKCPTLPEPDRGNGCPLVPRSLAIGYAPIDHKFLGTLECGRRALRARQWVYVYVVRPGKDGLVGKGRTRGDGSFAVTFAATKANYYAIVRGSIVPTVGQAKRTRSNLLVLHAIS
jgi:hypothetical protein